MPKPPNKYLVALRIVEAIHAGVFDPQLAQLFTSLVADIKVGRPNVTTRLSGLLAAAWSHTGRRAAAATKPAELRKALSALRAMAELEAKLGMTPPDLAFAAGGKHRTAKAPKPTVVPASSYAASMPASPPHQQDSPGEAGGGWRWGAAK